MKFRAAHPQHLEGDYSKPSDKVGKSPYDNTIPLGDSYTSTSTILNIDLFSLSAQTTNFNGYLGQGFKLTGLTSGAEAVVSVAKVPTRVIELICTDVLVAAMFVQFVPS